MRQYTYENKVLLREAAKDIAGLRVVDSEATYLLWLNVSGITEDGDALCRFLREETGLVLSRGGQYGPGGESFLRFNTACPRSMMEDGTARLKRGIEAFRG